MATNRGRSAGSGALAGVGLAAFVDEAVFHQLLHWHHFYDGGGPGARLRSRRLLPPPRRRGGGARTVPLRRPAAPARPRRPCLVGRDPAGPGRLRALRLARAAQAPAAAPDP